MKNLVLASALGTLAGTFAVPMLAGPIHFATTKPHSMFGLVPPGSPGSTPVSVTLGTVPMDFVLTDVLYGATPLAWIIKANGNPVLCGGGTGSSLGYGVTGNLHLTTGVL